jgi:hypothetical protein
MPKVEIVSANSGKDTYKAPHERMHGNWDTWELDDAGRTLERAEAIKSNGKFMDAIAKHFDKKAAEHRKLADGMRSHMKRGLVSEKQLEKASKKS